MEEQKVITKRLYHKFVDQLKASMNWEYMEYRPIWRDLINIERDIERGQYMIGDIGMSISDVQAYLSKLLVRYGDCEVKLVGGIRLGERSFWEEDGCIKIGIVPLNSDHSRYGSRHILEHITESE